MALLVVQGNLNHCAAAQDLLVQSLAQWGIQLAVVAEPYYVPPRSDWAGDLDGSVAIIVRTAAACPPLADVVRGRGYVAATIGEIVVLGGYFSPNRRLADFEGWIEEVGTVVARSRPRPVLVLGDLNAKSVAWGSPSTCARGEALEEWVIEKGLVVLNRGSVHTCVRQQGGSIADVSFASPELARRVRDWRVVTGVETLSDHRYIRFSVSARNPDPPSREPPVGDCPRWALKKLDREVFKEALIVATWASGPDANPPDVNVEQEADNLRSLVTGVCDAAMPRRVTVITEDKHVKCQRVLLNFCLAYRQLVNFNYLILILNFVVFLGCFSVVSSWSYESDYNKISHNTYVSTFHDMGAWKVV
ncbi:hypothetical protein K1T71_012292 [Dendrolimus kikuchii]|uniref:Uncharacterized protein n=1 Tax=Dendrolimus kikuchii TaxID=765133 RepID=A0ACC1CL48_9NEOP|nr:hypothetical protein K1T71_012292 [Dendrolimus kikuchii]